jgi:CHASE1-domain containing sensor protein
LSNDIGLKQMAIRFPRIPLSLLILAVLAGPLIGFGVFRLAAGVERDRAQAHLERQVAASALAIERELAADLEVLYAVKTLFETDQPVQYERFAAMAEPIFARHPCFQALEWVPRIAHRSRRAHEQKQSGREDGLENYLSSHPSRATNRRSGSTLARNRFAGRPSIVPPQAKRSR